jgi:hypothetical protein
MTGFGLVLHDVRAFLGDRLRVHLACLLRSDRLDWARADLLGRSTTGGVWQLADPAMHRRPEIVELSTAMVGSVYAELRRIHDLDLPEPEDLVPQVFPVVMTGSPVDPTGQRPHRDNADGDPPLVTAIYYVDVKDVTGGALSLHDPAGRVVARIEPVTVVTNFYRVRNDHAAEGSHRRGR